MENKMTTDQPSASTRPALPFIAALLITLVMGVGMTALDVWQPEEPRLSILAFLPGLVSIAALFASGSSWSDHYLRFGRLSRPGLLVLAATTILLLPILGSNSGWSGWKWLPALIYAPASGIAQELYFRSSLLPALERVLGGKKIPALLLHGLLFIGYHLRTFRSVPSLPISLLIASVLFAAGCGWGWQVQKDRTVVWAMLQHSLFLMLMSMFEYG
jgi:membrane protease YdiL (CAAX protease family)